MRTAKFLSFLPGIRKLSGEVERLREERLRHREELAQLRSERKSLREELSDLRKSYTRTLLELQTEPSYAKRSLQSVLDRPKTDPSFLEGEVSCDLEIDDDMLWKTTSSHYFRTGFEAVRLMRDSLERLNVDPASLEFVLDLPSGYGRVTRFIRAWLPEVKISVCDLQEAGARFCAEKFDCELVAASEDPKAMTLDHPVDLIWCGSLVTHLDAGSYRQFLACFTDFLRPDGLLFFSNHGDRAVDRLTSGKTTYGIPEEAHEALVEDWRRDGFGYRDYPGIEGYGISLASRDWVERLTESIENLELVEYLPREWAGHHDVAVCRRS